jgi:hypothetical protein
MQLSDGISLAEGKCVEPCGDEKSDHVFKNIMPYLWTKVNADIFDRLIHSLYDQIGGLSRGGHVCDESERCGTHMNHSQRCLALCLD